MAIDVGSSHHESKNDDKQPRERRAQRIRINLVLFLASITIKVFASSRSILLAMGPKPAAETIIDVRLRDIRQLFNSLDATPFPETDLDADAEDFLLSWALDSSRSLPIRIRLHVQDLAEGSNIEEITEQTETALRNNFEYKADVLQRRLRHLLAQGRTRLVIGASVLIVALLAANVVDRVAGQSEESPFWNILHESLLIGGWVSMWGPLEILLYGWWPIRHERSVCLHLSRATVEIVDLESRNIPA